ncbi:D-glucuronyl C5-epimerase C-terminus [Nonomuraea pusilla]|uniref:D-glucuronyl C5-epimerase C-terminus n=1 Tax=Nonomuraea pusilla TaxID=46177 RepID=A0A1H7FV69_9ACTN|nr:D-glucuronyl C5-epimerase C-terminus [Nonomuraea pusilla]
MVPLLRKFIVLVAALCSLGGCVSTSASTSGEPAAVPATQAPIGLFRATVPGLRAGEELYLPLRALRERFGLDVSTGPDGVVRAGYVADDTPLVKRHDPRGPWLHFAQVDVTTWRRISIGPDGIPLSTYDFGTFQYPVEVAQYGMENYSKWVTTGQESYRAKAETVARWLLEHQDDAGGWPVPFAYSYREGLAGELRAGWYSGMAQGIGAAFLAKMRARTGETRYGDAALRALRPLRTEVARGGVLRRFEDRFDWFEEYPTPTPTHVLNGHLFALIGVHDVGELTGDAAAKDMFRRGLATLDRMLPLYDLSSRTSYDLLHYTRTPATAPNPARWSYHSLHVTQLSALNAITGGRYRAIEQRWLGYLDGKALPGN